MKYYSSDLFITFQTGFPIVTDLKSGIRLYTTSMDVNSKPPAFTNSVTNSGLVSDI